jgi:hypothetical protein
MPKCKQCGFTPPKKEKTDNKKKRLESLMSLFEVYEFNPYSGKVDLEDIWNDFREKITTYNGDNEVSVRAVVDRVGEKPPVQKIVDLIKLLR